MATSGAQNATDHARGHQKCRPPISAICGNSLYVFGRTTVVHTLNTAYHRHPQKHIIAIQRSDGWINGTSPSVFILQTMTSPHSEPSLFSQQPNEEVASRCETVLNATMAEIETYHTQKVEDFASLAKEHLDGEIEFYEQVSDEETDKLFFSLNPSLTSYDPLPSLCPVLNGTGPSASTHGAPHIRTTDIPTSLVERHAPTIHLRARPRPSPTKPRPTPTTVSARVGRDIIVAREPGDTGGRRNVVGQRC